MMAWGTFCGCYFHVATIGPELNRGENLKKNLVLGRVERNDAVSLLRIAFARIVGQNHLWKYTPTAFHYTVA